MNLKIEEVVGAKDASKQEFLKAVREVCHE